MRPLVQKLPLDTDHSFVARTFRTPNFEVGWHQHPEFELIAFTEGKGMSFIGNHVGSFDTGDIYFLGSNLPHTFQKSGDLVTSAVVVQFRENFWGSNFLHLPENKCIYQMMEQSSGGLKVQGVNKDRIEALVLRLEFAKGPERILILLQCLQLIAEKKEFTVVSGNRLFSASKKDQDCIDSVFQFTIDHFREPVSLSRISSIVCMSIPAFCRYFKKRTQKTYVDFLNEVRIHFACNQILETSESIANIGYTSGFNTIAHFHRQFLKLKGMTPLQYRKSFAEEKISKGKKIGIE